MKLSWLWLVALVFAIGCDEPAEDYGTTLSGQFKKKKLDLRWALSDYFSVMESSDSSVTSYEVSYDRPTRTNFVTEKSSGDTVFTGYAMKYKGLWFLEQAVSDSTFVLNAIKIRNGSVYGWLETDEQMRRLDSVAGTGALDDLVQKQSEKLTIVDANRKAITKYFQSWVASAEEKFLVDQGKIDFVAIESDVTGIDGGDVIRMLETLYPNPANDKFRLGLYETRELRVKIFDLRGQLVVNEIQNTQDKEYDVSAWEPGVYVVSLRDPVTDTPIDQANLTIRR